MSSSPPGSSDVTTPASPAPPGGRLLLVQPAAFRVQEGGVEPTFFRVTGPVDGDYSNINYGSGAPGGPGDGIDDGSLGYSLTSEERRELLGSSVSRVESGGDVGEDVAEVEDGDSVVLTETDEGLDPLTRTSAAEATSKAQAYDDSDDDAKKIPTVRSGSNTTTGRLDGISYGGVAEQRLRTERMRWYETWDYDALDQQYADAWKIAKESVGVVEEEGMEKRTFTDAEYEFLDRRMDAFPADIGHKKPVKVSYPDYYIHKTKRGGDTVFEYQVRSRSLYEIRQLERKHQNKILVPSFVGWKLSTKAGLQSIGENAKRSGTVSGTVRNVGLSDNIKSKLESGKSTLLLHPDEFRTKTMFSNWARVATRNKRAEHSAKFAVRVMNVKSQRVLFNTLLAWRMMVRKNNFKREMFGVGESDDITAQQTFLANVDESGEGNNTSAQASAQTSTSSNDPNQQYHNLHNRVLADRVRSLHKNIFNLDRPQASRAHVLELFERLERHFQKVDMAGFLTHFFGLWRVFTCSSKSKKLQELNVKAEAERLSTSSENDAVKGELKKARELLMTFQHKLQEKVGKLSSEYEDRFNNMQLDYEKILDEGRAWGRKADMERRGAIGMLQVAESDLQEKRDEARYLKARVAALEQELAEVRDGRAFGACPHTHETCVNPGCFLHFGKFAGNATARGGSSGGMGTAGEGDLSGSTTLDQWPPMSGRSDWPVSGRSSGGLNNSMNLSRDGGGLGGEEVTGVAESGERDGLNNISTTDVDPQQGSMGTARSARSSRGQAATDREEATPDLLMKSVEFDDVYEEGDYEVFDPFADGTGGSASGTGDGSSGAGDGNDGDPLLHKLAAIMEGDRHVSDFKTESGLKPGTVQSVKAPPRPMSPGLKKLKQEVYDTLNSSKTDAPGGAAPAATLLQPGVGVVAGGRGSQTQGQGGPSAISTQTAGSGLAIETSLHEPALTERAVTRALRKLGAVLLPEADMLKGTLMRQYKRVKELEGVLSADKAPLIEGSRLQSIAEAKSDASFLVNYLMALSEVLSHVCFDEMHSAVEVADGKIDFENAELIESGGNTVLLLPALVTETGLQRVVGGVGRALAEGGGGKDGSMELEQRLRKLVEADKTVSSLKKEHIVKMVSGLVNGENGSGLSIVGLLPSAELIAALGGGVDEGVENQRWKLTEEEEGRLHRFVEEILIPRLIEVGASVVSIMANAIQEDLGRRKGGSVFGLCDLKVVEALAANVLAGIIGVVEKDVWISPSPSKTTGVGGNSVNKGVGAGVLEGSSAAGSAAGSISGMPGSGNNKNKKPAVGSASSNLESLPSDSDEFANLAKELSDIEADDAALFNEEAAEHQMIEGIYLVRRLFGREKTKMFQRAGVIPRAAWRLVLRVEGLGFCELRADKEAWAKYQENVLAQVQSGELGGHQDSILGTVGVGGVGGKGESPRVGGGVGGVDGEDIMNVLVKEELVGYNMKDHGVSSKRSSAKNKWRRQIVPIGELDR